MATFQEAKDLKPNWTVGFGSQEKGTYQVVKLSLVKVCDAVVRLSGKSSTGNPLVVEVGKFDRIPVLSVECIAHPIETSTDESDISRQLVDSFLATLENYPDGQRRLLQILQKDLPTES